MTGMSIVEVVLDRARRSGERVAYRHLVAGQWRATTWRELGEKVVDVAAALIELGVEEQGTVAIFSSNRPEWTITDLGALAVRAVAVPIYPTSTAAQAQFIVDDAATNVVFVGGQEQYDRVGSFATPDRPTLVVALDESVVLDPSMRSMRFSELVALGRRSTRGQEVEERLARLAPEDLLTLIYTSGTTGEPKGVMLTHANLAACFAGHDQRLDDTGEDDASLCFLPLSHVFERCWTYYVLFRGMTNHYLEDPTRVVEALQQVRPTIMCAVPRFYEKVYAAIHARLERASPVRQRLFHWAIGVGREMGLLRKDGLRASPGLRARYRLADALVLSKLRAIVGGRVKYFPCAGAPLSREIEEFFHAAGIFIRYGYGLTETTATVSCHETTGFTFGTVGRPLAGVEVRIGEGDEIQVRGATVMKGYFKRPEATAEVFVDGWLRTGDAGRLDERGLVVITDRIKDLIKTSGGKYIAPQLIESRIGSDPLIEQVAVIGDQRRFVSALLVPAFASLEDLATARGWSFSSRDELVALPEVRALYQQRIDGCNAELARYEQVRKFTLLPRELTVDAGEITPTLKVRRRQVEQRYREAIETMYR